MDSKVRRAGRKRRTRSCGARRARRGLAGIKDVLKKMPSPRLRLVGRCWGASKISLRAWAERVVARSAPRIQRRWEGAAVLVAVRGMPAAEQTADRCASGGENRRPRTGTKGSVVCRRHALRLLRHPRAHRHSLPRCPWWFAGSPTAPPGWCTPPPSLRCYRRAPAPVWPPGPSAGWRAPCNRSATRPVAEPAVDRTSSAWKCRRDRSAVNRCRPCTDRYQRHAPQVVHGVVARGLGCQLMPLRLEGCSCIDGAHCGEVGAGKCRNEQAAMQRERRQTGGRSWRCGNFWHGRSVPDSKQHHFTHCMVRAAAGRQAQQIAGTQCNGGGQKTPGVTVSTLDKGACSCAKAAASAAALPEASQIRKRMPVDRAAAGVHPPAQRWSP